MNANYNAETINANANHDYNSINRDAASINTYASAYISAYKSAVDILAMQRRCVEEGSMPVAEDEAVWQFALDIFGGNELDAGGFMMREKLFDDVDAAYNARYKES